MKSTHYHSSLYLLTKKRKIWLCTTSGQKKKLGDSSLLLLQLLFYDLSPDFFYFFLAFFFSTDFFHFAILWKVTQKIFFHFRSHFCSSTYQKQNMNEPKINQEFGLKFFLELQTFFVHFCAMILCNQKPPLYITATIMQKINVKTENVHCGDV